MEKNCKKTRIISAIEEGTVIDHIPSRVTFKIMKILDPQEYENTITIGLNLESGKLGKKGVIKISSRFLTAEEFDKIAILAPEATVNIIKDYEVKKKIKVTLPQKIEGIMKCANPNCITNNEEVRTKFAVVNESPLKIMCVYCERIISREDIILN
jgi:aspartate carbamoyltransferase regulatory subunit